MHVSRVGPRVFRTDGDQPALSSTAYHTELQRPPDHVREERDDFNTHAALPASNGLLEILRPIDQHFACRQIHLLQMPRHSGYQIFFRAPNHHHRMRRHLEEVL